MAAATNGSSPANPLLGTPDEIEAVSVHAAARSESRPPSHSDDNGETHGRTFYRRTARTRREQPEKALSKLWWKEILSILLSLSFLAANVGVLASINHKPYESWHIAGVDLTPNAIISVIATATKASLLLPVAEAVVQLKWLYFQARVQTLSDLQVFDDASRGPLGSLRLLWRINIRSALASLGALIIIFALAAEPFTQQVVRYPITDSVATNVSAAISKTDQFQPSSLSTSQDDYTLGETAYLQQLNVAANSGISRPVGDASYDCPSGSCSWDPFTSLALCNSCVDFANYTVTNCTAVPKAGLGYRLCSYTLSPDVSSEVYTDGPPLLAWNLWNRVGNTTWQPNTWMNITQDYTDGFDVESLFLKLAVVRFNDSYSSTSSLPDDILPTVMRCELAWCAQYHSSSNVHDGTLYDEPDFSVPIVSAAGGYLPDESKIPAGYATTFNSTVEPFQIDNDFSEIFQYLLASVVQSEVFNPSRRLAQQTYILEALPASYSSDYVSSIAAVSSSSDGFVTADPSTATANEGRMYTLYYANGGNVFQTLDNVAASVTIQMRSGLASTNVTGSVTYPVTYIKVIWPWFIYPAVLVVLAAALLAVTIRVSCDKLVWKSSSLALLFHGLPDEESNGMLSEIEQMEAAADQVWAQLSKSEDRGVRLKTL